MLIGGRLFQENLQMDMNGDFVALDVYTGDGDDMLPDYLKELIINSKKVKSILTTKGKKKKKTPATSVNNEESSLSSKRLKTDHRENRWQYPRLGENNGKQEINILFFWKKTFSSQSALYAKGWSRQQLV